ncbi:MAG: hypothetical protein KAR39_13265 [Thermoplasmata archaeon]|nr:hypothetical protein [Thermoplasmata archaeon]
MSRQLELEQEVRETAKRDALVKALEFGIVGSLQNQGIELRGIGIKHDAFNCLLTIRADVAGVRSVAFVGSDSIVNCILKADSEAARHALRWRPDQYHTSKD